MCELIGRAIEQAIQRRRLLGGAGASVLAAVLGKPALRCGDRAAGVVPLSADVSPQFLRPPEARQHIVVAWALRLCRSVVVAVNPSIYYCCFGGVAFETCIAMCHEPASLTAVTPACPLGPLGNMKSR